MSRLKDLLHVAPPSTGNTQQRLLQCCVPVAQQTQQAQQMGNDATLRKDWQEFEGLLAIVGPAYRTPAHEYDVIRATARRDLPSALEGYREMAKQIAAIR